VLSGLIETLAGPPYHGHADLPVLASQLQLEADEILHLGESLQLLRFAQLSEGDLMLTDTGAGAVTVTVAAAFLVVSAALVAVTV